MSKRSIMCTVMFVIMIFFINTNGIISHAVGDYSYVVHSDNVMITKYNGTANGVVIPATIEGKPVISFGENVFMGNKDITSVTIPSSIRNIPENAFLLCSNLKTVTIQGSTNAAGDYRGVDNIEARAFKECTSLTIVNFPDVVTKTNNGNTWYDGVSTIKEEAFSGCTSLKDITLPDSVNQVYGYAFQNCSSLESIIFPKNITAISQYIFKNCRNLERITLPDCVTGIYTSAFARCTSLRTIIIPNNVTRLGHDVFQGCSGLTNITIPDKVKYMGMYTFAGCTKLASVIISDNSTLNSIGQNAFSGCVKLVSIKLPNSVKTMGKKIFFGCSGLETVENMPNTIDSIAEGTFYGCTKLKNIVIPSATKTIGFNTFRDCKALESVAISNVTSIGAQGFFGCSSLNNVVIPSAMTSIGDSVFSGCTGLINITLPSTVKTIGSSAFSRCSSLTNIDTMLTNIETIGNNGFGNCTGLSTITIPAGVTSVGNDAFLGCTEVTSVKFKGNETSIGYEGFYGCVKLETVELPTNIDSISDKVFHGCKALKTIIIPETVKSIGQSAFYDCDALTQITIPDGITSIGRYAFKECDSLTEIILPSSVNSIAYWAFKDCSRLAKVTILGKDASIGGEAIIGCDADLEIHGYGGSTAQTYADAQTITFVDISVIPNNPPTVAHKIGDIVDRKVGIAVSVNLENVFEDMDDDTLTYLANIGELSEMWWSYTPVASDVGKEIIVTITANDSKGGSIIDEFKISNITADVIIPPYTPPTAKDKVEITVTTEAVTTYGGSDGKIIVTTSGAITCEFSKDNGIHWQNENVFKNLISGIYKVVARNKNDIDNVSEVIEVIISQPDKPVTPNRPSSSSGRSSKSNKETNVFKSDDKITIYNNTKVGMDVFKQLKEKKQRELTLKGDIFSITFSGGGEVKEMPVKEIDLDLSFKSPNQKDIKKLTGHRDIVNLYFTYHGELPTTGKVTVNIGDKYKNKKMYLYYYNKDNNSLELYGLLNSDGKVTFSIDHCSDYVLSEDLILKSNPFKENIDTLAYIRGGASGDFGADNNITRGETATLLNNILADSNTSSNKEFSDIDMWAKEAILQLANLGYINGYKDGTFKPNNNITRAEFVKIITNIIDIKDTQSFRDETLSDINGNWAEKDIKVCYELGLINGFGGEFSPDDYISRAEAVTIVNKLINREISDNNKENPFDDLSEGHWAYLQIMSAIK